METGRRSQSWLACPPTGRYHRGTLRVKPAVCGDALIAGGAGLPTRTEEHRASGRPGSETLRRMRHPKVNGAWEGYRASHRRVFARHAADLGVLGRIRRSPSILTVIQVRRTFVMD
jgi:hypothetical protein